MTYVLSDDKTFRQTGLRLAGKDAALLYATALHECAAEDGDGVLTPLMVKDAAGLYDLNAKRLAPRLVEHGLWHDPVTLEQCGSCLEYTESLAEGAFLIHEWWKPLLHKEGKNDPVKRDRELRRKRLWRNKSLVLSVRSRDKDVCRYCGEPCTDPSGPDKKDPLGLTLDHVDPWGDNTLGNVVVACRRCNGIKRNRTPSEAGMTVLKPGTRVGRSDTDQTPGTDTDQTLACATREAGRIRHGSDRDGSRSGTGPVPDQTQKEHT